MALIENLNKLVMDRNTVHDPVDATYTVFQSDDGDVFLQIDTYGSSSRRLPGKKSQSIQLGPAGISALEQILKSMPRRN